jgi:hypothetical protein
MRDWSKALETAFVASLKPGGNSGNVGNRSEKASHCKPHTLTKAAQGGYRTEVTGNLQDRSFGSPQIVQKQSLEPPVTKVTGVTESLSDASFEERAALIEYGANVPRHWAEGFAGLDLSAPPRGFSYARWRTIVNDGGRFLDRWADEAARLGWQATDVFGVHPIAPSARFDAMGLVPIIGGGEVISINERSATIRSPGGQLLFYMRRPSSGAVCLWDRSVHDAHNGVIGNGSLSPGDSECLDDNNCKSSKEGSSTRTETKAKD